MAGLGWPEILVILLLALIFFGPRKLPELGRSLGQGLREFKKATREMTDAIKEEAEEAPKKD